MTENLILATHVASQFDHVHARIFFTAAVAILAAMTLPILFLNLERSVERRLYWTGNAIAMTFAFISAIPNWKLMVFAVTFFPLSAWFFAYTYTPYVKIRGKIYAFHVEDPDPLPDGAPPPCYGDPRYDPAPDAYLSIFGVITAKRFWWLLISVLTLCDFAVIVRDASTPTWFLPVGVVGLVLAPVALGHIDASWGYPVARGQRLQFSVATVITAGIFGVLYLLAYRAGKRWPWRYRKSGEYLIHPRFRDEDR